MYIFWVMDLYFGLSLFKSLKLEKKISPLEFNGCSLVHLGGYDYPLKCPSPCCYLSFFFHFCLYLTTIESGENPALSRISLTFGLCSPCNSILPPLMVPPHANVLLSFFASSFMSISLLSIPSTIV